MFFGLGFLILILIIAGIVAAIYYHRRGDF